MLAFFLKVLFLEFTARPQNASFLKVDLNVCFLKKVYCSLQWSNFVGDEIWWRKNGTLKYKLSQLGKLDKTEFCSFVGIGNALIANMFQSTFWNNYRPISILDTGKSKCHCVRPFTKLKFNFHDCDITSERNVQGQTLQGRGMYKDRHYKGEECNDDRCNKWKEGTGDGHYKWEQCKGNEHHTYGHYITLFAEQLTRTFEVLVIQGFLFYLILLLGSAIKSTPSNLSPADRRAVIPRSQ